MLLGDILSHQIIKQNPQFDIGSFPSFRNYKYLNLSRPDNNLFCSLLVFRLLQDNSKSLSAIEKSELQKAIVRYQESLSLFVRIENNTKVYQYWHYKPNAHFPNGKLLHRYKKFAIPPDADDTALAYLVYNHSQEDAIKLKHNLERFADPNDKVYCTWFGTGKMKLEKDIVVQLNILEFIYSYNLSESEYETNTLQYISNIIDKRLIEKLPFQISRNYVNPIIILYFLCRFAAKFNQFKNQKQTLLETITLLNKNKVSLNLMDSVLLNSCSLFLGEKPTITNFTIDQSIHNWPIYYAGMLNIASSSLSKFLAPNKAFHWSFCCEALSKSFILENQILTHQV